MDHHHNLHSLLLSCNDKGIKLNKDKFWLNQSQVTYMGHILAPDGLRPDPRNVAAIVKMQSQARRSASESGTVRPNR